MAGTDPFVGSFSGDRLQVEIALDPNPQRPGYIGTLHFGGRQFPFTATRRGDQIVGRFKSGEDAFEFSATLAGSALTFETAGTTYRLMRIAPVPAAHRPPPTTREAPTSGPTAIAPPRRAPVTTAPATRPTGGLELKPAVVYDAMMDCEAASLRVPEGWKCRLDVVWRQNPYDPAVIAGTVSEPNGPARVSIFPRLSFIDGVPARGGAGGTYMGAEIRPPLASPTDYIRQVILPRFRTDVADVRFASETDLPDLARDQLPKFQKVPGVRVKASRVRVVYSLNGNPMEEEFVCTVGTVPLSGEMVAWGAECSSYRAARGKLDSMLPLFRRIASSLQVSLPWHAGVLEVSERMQQDLPASTTDVARLSQYISQRSSQISDLARASYERRERVLARCNADVDAATGGIAGNTAPIAGSPIPIPAH